MPGKLWLDVVKDAGNGWMEHKAMRLAAAVAFYTLLSMAPLLVIAVSVAGFFFDDAAVRNGLDRQMQELVGPSGAEVIKSALENAANKPKSGTLASVIGIVSLLFAAAGVFGELQDSMNTVWEVKPKEGRGVWGIVKDRFLSFGMVLVIGFLLLVSLVISAVVAGMSEYFKQALPGLPWLPQALNLVAGFFVVALLFALMFKVLPDVHVGWPEVVFGAVVTSLLFTVGRFLIGLYLGKAGVGDAFGAAGSVVALVVWVYYSALILFFGVELTRAFARRMGSGKVADNAVPVTAEAKAREGLATAGV
jgi:membrane protein